MKSFRKFFHNLDWNLILLTFYAVCLPFSESFISISTGLIVIIFLIQAVKDKSFPGHHFNVLWITGIYIIFVISFFFSSNKSLAYYDLKKNIFFLAIPFAYYLILRLTSRQKVVLLSFFTLAVIISSIYTLCNFLFHNPGKLTGIHEAGFISHIRFSLQVILGFWFLWYLIKYNYKKPDKRLFMAVFGAGFLLLFIFLLQSLIGMIAFLISVFAFLIIEIRNLSRSRRWLIYFSLMILLLAPVSYLIWVIDRFYNIETIDKANIDKVTAKGNYYYHDFSNPMVENGRFVNIYICDDELREEWNKVSRLKYDATDKNGFPVKATLIRYLTSKGLRKDADGVRALKQPDIENIENGIANYIFSGRKFSIYPRIYQTIWEYYIYSKTGYADYQSFSQRIIFMKAAFSIIKNNFLFGVGIGNWKKAFDDAYKHIGTNLKPELYGSAHNQYLNYLVKFGFLGFLLILFFILYPVVKSKKYRDPLFMIFLVYMAVANLGDSNLESHVGGAFFVFFFCFFIQGESIDFHIKKHEAHYRTNHIDL